MYAHVPQAADELELRIGDYIYVSKECIDNSIDGWAEGTSWLTGNIHICSNVILNVYGFLIF